MSQSIFKIFQKIEKELSRYIKINKALEIIRSSTHMKSVLILQIKEFNLYSYGAMRRRRLI